MTYAETCIPNSDKRYNITILGNINFFSTKPDFKKI